MIDFDLTVFERENSCLGGIFRTGPAKVGEIRGTPDKKIEFADYNGRTLCCITSCSGQRAIYPLDEAVFAAPAEYVVMDLDGTSIVSEEFWIDIIEQTVCRLTGKTIHFSAEDLPYVSGHSTGEHLDYALKKYGSGSYENAMETYHEISHRELSALFKGNRGKIKPAKGLKEFLLALKNRGIRVGLVSSGLFYKAIPEIEAAFDVMELGDSREFYDGIIMGGVEKGPGKYSTLGELAAKPHPWLYKELAYSGLKCKNPEKLIVLEDSASGVLSARLAGYPVIGMTGGNIRASGLEKLCTAQADSLEQALRYILGGNE